MTDHAGVILVPDEAPLLRLRTAADLLEALPYLLGFHPTESLVVVMVHGTQGRVGATLRCDLPPDNAADLAALAHDVAALASLHAAERTILVVVSDRSPTADGLPARPLVGQLCTVLARAGVAVVDALHVRGRRWWSYLCGCLQCCPADGRPLPAPDTAPSDIAAAAARAQLTAHADRAALSSTLELVDGSVRESMERALAAAEVAFVESAATTGGMPAWRDETRARIRAVLDRALGQAPGSTSAELTERESAEMLVALSDLPIRDYCWRTIEQGGPGDAVALWSQFVRRAVPPYDAAPLFLLGWAAWRRGDGVLARMAAERALRSESDYGAARLLLHAVNAGIDPREVPNLTARRPATPRAVAGWTR
jgi:hypothetical protein